MTDMDRTVTRVLVVGGRSGIAKAIAAEGARRGAEVLLAVRHRSTDPVKGGRHEVELDLADEASIATAAARLGEVDHVVNVAAAHANGPVAALDRAAVLGAFDAKVFGPMLLAKHFAARIRPGGSLLLFSGVAAWRPAPGRVVMATANGAVATLAEALAVELAPVRVNALSPGIVDSGAWDALGAGRDAFFARTAAANPARRVGTVEDVAAAVWFALSNPFLTGTTLHVDGGGRLA